MPHRIVLCGAGSLARGLAARIRDAVGLDTELVGAYGLDGVAEPERFAVAVGLAIRKFDYK